MCIHVCVFCYKKISNIVQNLTHTCVFFSQASTFGIFQWVMVIDHCHLIALQSLKQEFYTPLGVRTWQIYIGLRNESTLAFFLHVFIIYSPSMNVKTKLRNLLKHGKKKNWNHCPHLEMWLTIKCTMKWLWLKMIMIMFLIWLEKVMPSLSLHQKIIKKKWIIIY